MMRAMGRPLPFGLVVLLAPAGAHLYVLNVGRAPVDVMVAQPRARRPLWSGPLGPWTLLPTFADELRAPYGQWMYGQVSAQLGRPVANFEAVAAP